MAENNTTEIETGTTDTSEVNSSEEQNVNEEERLTSIENASNEELDNALKGFEKYGDDFVEKMLNGDQPEDKNVDAQQGEDNGSQEQKLEEETEPEKKSSDTDVEERMSAIMKRIEGLELLTKRNSSERGELKKQLKDVIQTLKESAQDKFSTGQMEEALSDRDKIKEAEQQIQSIDQAEVLEKNKLLMQKLTAIYVKPGELEAEDVENTLKESGIPEGDIRNIMDRPEAVLSPGEYFHLIQGAKANRKVRILATYAQKLKMENDTLKKNSNPDSVLQNINKTFKTPKTMTASAGNSSGSSKPLFLTDSEISKLSSGELDEVLKSFS